MHWQVRAMAGGVAVKLPICRRQITKRSEMTNPLLEVLIIAAISIFVLSRLYVALGKDDGPPAGRTRVKTPQPTPQNTDNVTPIHAETPSNDPIFTGPAAAGLEAIYRADNNFNTRDFLLGARSAYEMIVAAFARGDRDALKPLLDTDVYEAWDSAISAREDSGDAPFELLRVKKVEIDEADLDGTGMARVMVRYDAELGDGETTRKASEIWTFMRDTATDDPNWILDDVEQAN